MSSVLTIKQLASTLRIAPSSAYGLVRRGDVRSIRVGRAIRIPVDAVDEFLSRQPDGADHRGEN